MQSSPFGKGTDADASPDDPFKNTYWSFVDGKVYNIGEGARVVGSSDVASLGPASNNSVQSSCGGFGNGETSFFSKEASAPFAPSPFAANANSTGNATSSASGMFGSGDASFTLFVKHDSHHIRQFVPPSSSLDPLLQWKATMDYLGKVGDACHYIDAELAKLKAAKSRLLALAVPAWSLTKTVGFQDS